MKNLKKYLEKTGQDENEILAGQFQFGPAHISQLIDQALQENKKLVFIKDKPGNELDLNGRYELQAF